MASMATWHDLKTVLVELCDGQPDALLQYPMPDRDDNRQPPFVIHLAPWALSAAEDLHRQFGSTVDLTVGALPYPPGAPPRQRHDTGETAELLDPDEIATELAGPAVVASGHDLEHSLLVRNLTDRQLQIATNGQVTAVVVDPSTGEVVGGFAGAQRLPLIVFEIAPGQTEPIPLLTGTASFTPRLGYAVPPGEWGIRATLTVGPDPDSSPRRRTPVMPLTITS
jgi:hypothetical protein